MDQRQGQLPFPQIGPGVLTQGLGILGIVQQVIGHLKRQAQMVPVAGQGLHNIRFGTGHQGTGSAGPLKQNGCLAANHIHVSVFGEGDVPLFFQLADFTLGHVFR
jgi:hypothetical protein